MFHFISYASTSGSSYTEVSYYLHLSQTHHNAICQTPPRLPYHIHQPLSWSFQHSPSGPSLPSPLSISITFLSVSPHFLPSAQEHQHIEEFTWQSFTQLFRDHVHYNHKQQWAQNRALMQTHFHFKTVAVPITRPNSCSSSVIH